jgi:hypothetical protein
MSTEGADWFETAQKWLELSGLASVRHRLSRNLLLWLQFRRAALGRFTEL